MTDLVRVHNISHLISLFFLLSVVLETGGALAEQIQIDCRLVKDVTVPEVLQLKPLRQDQDIVELRNELMRELQSQGFKVRGHDAKASLAYHMSQGQSQYVPGGSNLGTLHGDSQEGVRMEMNIWSTQEDSLLSGPKDREAYTTGNSGRVQLELIQEQTTVWYCTGILTGPTGSPQDIARAIVPYVVDYIGLTEKQTIPLD